MNIFLNVLAAQRVCGSTEVVHTGEEDSKGILITHYPFCHPLLLVLSFIYPRQPSITGNGLGAREEAWVTWGWSG